MITAIKYSSIVLFFVLAGVIALIAVPVYAATISLTPASISVQKGEVVTVTITVNPDGVKLGAIQVALSYPGSIVNATGFTPGAGLQALSMNDVTDNTAGSLVRTGGFPGGLTESKVFGIATFKSVADGTATIGVSSNSFAYDANGANRLSGTQGETTVTIPVVIQSTNITTEETQLPTPAPTPPPTPPTTQTIPQTSTAQTAPVEEPTEESAEDDTVLAEDDTILGEEAPVTQEPATASQPDSPSLLASVGSIISLGTDSVAVDLLVAVIVLAFAGYAIYAVIQRVRRKNLGKPR